jgi:citrate synthase
VIVQTGIAASAPEAIYIRGKSLVEDLMGKLDFTSMFVFQVRGRLPQPGERAVVDAILVTLMEHGMTPSSISARLIYASSPDALQSAVAGGLLAAGSVFLGSMEGLATVLQRGVREILDGSISPEGYCRAVVEDARSRGGRVPGFGHHIHRPDDPRTPRLLDIAHEHGVAAAHVHLLGTLARVVDEETGRHVTVNATGAIAAILSDLDYPPEIMRGFPLVARAAGLVGHLLEEQSVPIARELLALVEANVEYTGLGGSSDPDGDLRR